MCCLSKTLRRAHSRRGIDAFDLVTASASVKPTEASAVEYELQRLILDPDPDDRTTWIHVVRGNVYFTPVRLPSA